MKIVHHLFTGHHQVFRRILHLKQIPADQSETWIRVAVTYLTNHGRLDDVLEVISCCIMARDNAATKTYLERVRAHLFLFCSL